MPVKLHLGLIFPIQQKSISSDSLWFFTSLWSVSQRVFSVICCLSKTKGNTFSSKAMKNLRWKLTWLMLEPGKPMRFFHWLLQIKIKHSLCWMLLKEWSVLLITVNRWEHKLIATWAVAVLESGDCRMPCHSWADLIRLARVAEDAVTLADSLLWGYFFSSQPMPLCLHQGYDKLLKHCWVF